MTAGRGDLEGLPGDGLATHVGEVGHPVGAGFRIDGGGHRVPRSAAAETLDDVAELRRDPRPAPRRNRRFQRIGDGDDDVDLAERVDHRRHASDPAQRSIEAQLADERVPGDRVGGNLLRGHEQADRDGEVETGPRLALARRRQVDGDVAARPRESATGEGRLDSVARLLAHRIGHADEAVRREVRRPRTPRR